MGIIESYERDQHDNVGDVYDYNLGDWNAPLSGYESFPQLVKKYENCDVESIKYDTVDKMMVMLDNPQDCNLKYVDSKGISVLIATISLHLTGVVEKIMKYKDRVERDRRLGIVDDRGVFDENIKFRPTNAVCNSPLMIAIRKGYSDMALMMLSYPGQCRLNHVNNYGDTALTTALITGDEEVAMKILTLPDMIDIDVCNYNDQTALSLAEEKGMERVSKRIRSVFLMGRSQVFE